MRKAHHRNNPSQSKPSSLKGTFLLFVWLFMGLAASIFPAQATTPEQATKLSDLPWGAYDYAVDDSGNVVFNINDTPDKSMALRNGTPEDSLNYLIMGFVDDEPVTIDLSEYFDTEDDETPDFQVTLNSFPEVASTAIADNLLTVTFSAPGQTHIGITASLNNDQAHTTFVAGVMPVIEGDYHLTDFSNLSLEPESFWNGSDESGGFASGHAFFPNSYNPEWGAWSGWAYSNISDNTTPGWLNQYSAITGEAMDNHDENSGIYALTFVDGPGTVLAFDNPSAHEIKGLFITNTTFAALSMKYGDDFSKKFGGETGDDPDWFKVTVTGLRDGAETGTLDYYLADYRFEDNSKNYIIQTWQWLELSSLGKADSLVFSLSSTDMGDWGMNTPAYFAVDNIYIVPDLPPVVSHPIEDITADINADPVVLNIADVFTDPDDSDDAIVISITGNTNPDLVQTTLDGYELTLSFVQEQTGEAEVTLQALSNGKTVAESFVVNILPGTTVASHNNDVFSIYPNPSAGVFYIRYTKQDEAVLTITNTAGQVVYHRSASKGTDKVNLEELPAGIYMVSIRNASALHTSTMIIQ